MRDGIEAKGWRCLRVRRLACFLIGAVALCVHWPLIALAQPSTARQSTERFRPNNSVRTNRVPQVSQRLAQVPNRESPTPNGPVQAPAVQELPEMQTGDSNRDGAPQQFRVPLQEPDFQNMRIKSEDGLISIVARNSPLRDVLTLLAETQGLNIVTADPLSQTISVTLERVQLNDALDAVLSIAGYTFTIQRNIILISNLNNAGGMLTPQAQGLRLEVFQLDYVMAMDVKTAITGMLSPVGQSYIVSSSSTENRRPRELVAVNDLPQFLDRIRQYIAQVDIPPRQVLIEAHIFQVDLDDENRHGVNFDQLFPRNNDLLIQVGTAGLASAAANPLPGATPTPGFTFRFNDGNLKAVLECLRTQTDAKTLASPRILVLNGQQARLQVGQQLGFRVTTTTETSTTESVDFLDVGVVLEVTPRISRDGKIMMSVKPEVSSGQVNPTTGLPEEETTELDTDILLCDHEGVMIGGLIQEQDDDLQTKVAWIGDLPYVGRLFQRRVTTKRRSEIIIALIPRLVPYDPQYDQVAHEMYVRADTPLLYGPLVRVPRPWEPRLADAIDNPVMIRLPRVHDYSPWNQCPNCGRIFPGEACPDCSSLLGPVQFDLPPAPPTLPSESLDSANSPGPAAQPPRQFQPAIEPAPVAPPVFPPPVHVGRLPAVENASPITR